MLDSNLFCLCCKSWICFTHQATSPVLNKVLINYKQSHFVALEEGRGTWKREWDQAQQNCFLPYTKDNCFFSPSSGSSTAWLGHVVVMPKHTGPKVHCRPLHWYLVLLVMDFMLLSLTAAFPLYPVLCGCPLSQWFHPRSSCRVGQVPVQCFLCSDGEVQINYHNRGWGRPIHSPALLPNSGVSPLPGQLFKSSCRCSVTCKTQ